MNSIEVFFLILLGPFAFGVMCGRVMRWREMTDERRARELLPAVLIERAIDRFSQSPNAPPAYVDAHARALVLAEDERAFVEGMREGKPRRPPHEEPVE